MTLVTRSTQLLAMIGNGWAHCVTRSAQPLALIADGRAHCVTGAAQFLPMTTPMAGRRA